MELTADLPVAREAYMLDMLLLLKLFVVVWKRGSGHTRATIRSIIVRSNSAVRIPKSTEMEDFGGTVERELTPIDDVLLVFDIFTYNG